MFLYCLKDIVIHLYVAIFVLQSLHYTVILVIN